MKALITGASSGLGWDMAHILSKKGYDIIAVARREERLLKLKNELETNVEIICADITDYEQCVNIAKKACEADILINNAGFGVFGEFVSNDLNEELKMIDTNIRSLHILTKLTVQEYIKKGSGHIMNVASIASFFPGPLFSAYYASKSYVLRLSQGLSEELRKSGSNVKISVLCPGPTHTEFEKVAKVNFGSGSEKFKIVMSSRDVAEYAIKKMFQGKKVIIPGKIMKIAAYLRHILPDTLLAKVIYKIQSEKCVIK